MSQKLINTRIGLKYDTYANWTKVVEGEAFDTTFIPLKGEVIFYEIPTGSSASNPNPNTVTNVTPPAILFKVGDGETSLHDLAWGSAIAADVYNWAKQQSLLGGERTGSGSGAGWDFSQATEIQKDTQNEVGGFIGNLVKIEVEATGTPNQYEIKVSTDGGINWTSGGYITMTTETYIGDGITINIEDNTVSVIPAVLTYDSGNGLEVTTEGGVLTSDDVEPLVDYIQEQIASVPKYSISKQQTAETGYAATYVLLKDGVQEGDKINIPKDFVVKSATVETCTTADVPVQGLVPGNKYIDLVINTVDQSATNTHLYIPVKDLVTPYTGGDTTYISVSIDENNEITATLNRDMIADEIGSNTGDDLLTTVDAVRDYVQSEISQATPNIEAGDGIEISTSGTTKTVEVKLGTTPALGFDSGDGLEVVLDETTQTSQLTQSSGLQKTAYGLRIDDTVTWVLQCGGASPEE